jgi:Trm5-related predicted tRNA methylase
LSSRIFLDYSSPDDGLESEDHRSASGKVIINTMPTSKDVRPLTDEQVVQLRCDLTLVEERLQDIATLMRVCYGEDSQAVIRADETTAALQRLKWELERTKVREQAASA